MTREWERVAATADEIADYRKRYGANARPRVYRVRCTLCGKRYWGSGIGIGSHRRGCPGAPPAQETEA